MAIVNVDLLDVLKAYMAYDIWRRGKEEQKYAPAKEYVEKGPGWEAAEQQFGTGQAYKLYEHMFGKGVTPPQKLTYETKTQETPEGLSVTPQARTKRVWPTLTSAQMIEQGKAKFLTERPEAIPTYLGMSMMGEMGAGEKMKFEYEKRKDVATAASNSIIHKVNIMDPDGTLRPITGPEATTYWDNVLSGVTPSIQIAPPTKEADQWEWKNMLTQLLNKHGLYDRAYSSMNPAEQNLVREASSVGAAKIIDDFVRAPGYEEAGKDFEIVEKGLKGDMVQKFKLYTKGPKKGQEEPFGEAWSRREGAVITQKDYASYDLRIRDDARSMAIRDLMARGAMKIVQDPANPGQVMIQFAVPAEQGEKMLRESFTKHYKDGIRGAKSQGYLPKDWKEDPYGEEPSPQQGVDFLQMLRDMQRNKGTQPFVPTEQQAPIPKPESKILTKSMAEAILKEAGGDKEKARKLAKERGYKF